jgi:3-dehydroquinate synthase
LVGGGGWVAGDKKTVAGRLRFVLPTRLGHVELVDNVPEIEVRAVLDTKP